jgi:hypothetical protein
VAQAPVSGPRELLPDAPPSIRVEYRPPENPAHQPLYDEMRQRRILERMADVLALVHLPRPVTLTFVGCDGDSNAYYDVDSATIRFCYEFLADIRKAAEVKQTNPIVPMQDSKDGPMVFVMLHETGHAVIEQLKVPVLGRREDAADTFAAIHLLRMGKGMCLRLLAGAAWAYGHDGMSGALDDTDFSDTHSLDSQRYYNLLCLAYGSDPAFFTDLVTRGFLPEARAEGCAEEYHQAIYALQKLVMPALDERDLSAHARGDEPRSFRRAQADE